MSEPTRMSLRDKMFSFEGRLRRADYWFISIMLGIAVFTLTEIVMLAVFGPGYSLFTGGFPASDRRVAEGWPNLVQMLVSALTIWPSFAMAAKRAHDRDNSARVVIGVLALEWILSFVQIPLTAWQMRPEATTSDTMIQLGLGLLMFAPSVYLFVVVGCFDGTRGPNRFGPSPKASELPEPA